VFIGLAGLLTLGLIKAAAKPEPNGPGWPAPEPPLCTEKGTPLKACSRCGRPVAIRKDGQPYRSHRCVPVVPQTSIEPGVTVFEGDGITSSDPLAGAWREE
jgi:hypothetical protein